MPPSPHREVGFIVGTAMMSGAIQVLWHVFTGVGALLGFISTLFLIYDRLLRYRPVASIKAVRDKATLPAQVPPVLRIRNVAPFHLLVERFVVKPPYFRIMPNFFPVKGTKSLVIYGAGTPILLAPNEERDLAMVPHGPTIAKTERIDIIIHGRRDASTGPFQWPVRVRTSLADIELRQQAAMNELLNHESTE